MTLKDLFAQSFITFTEVDLEYGYLDFNGHFVEIRELYEDILDGIGFELFFSDGVETTETGDEIDSELITRITDYTIKWTEEELLAREVVKIEINYSTVRIVLR